MNVLKVIEAKQSEVTQQYSDFEQQEANINAEKLRLQGEHRAYEYLKEKIKEKKNASDSKNRSKQSRTGK